MINRLIDEEIWEASDESDCSINYKSSGNRKILCFEKEVTNLQNKIGEHLYKVEQSNSSLRYVLTVVLNPNCTYKKNGKFYTKILNKEEELRYAPTFNLNQQYDQKGYYLKTLKMTRDESIKAAIELLQSLDLSGYIYCEESYITRYKDDPVSQEFESWLLNL